MSGRFKLWGLRKNVKKITVTNETRKESVYHDLQSKTQSLETPELLKIEHRSDEATSTQLRPFSGETLSAGSRIATNPRERQSSSLWPDDESQAEMLGDPDLSVLLESLEIGAPNQLLDLVLPTSNSPISQILPGTLSGNELASISFGSGHRGQSQWPSNPVTYQPAEVLMRSPLRCKSLGEYLDVFYPTGNLYVYSSPFNEVYPFPTSVRESDETDGTTAVTQPSNIDLENSSLGTLLSMYPEGDPRWISMMRNHASASKALGKYQENEISLRKLLSYFEKTIGTDSPQALETSCGITEALFYQSKFELADEHHRHLLPRVLKLLPHTNSAFIRGLELKTGLPSTVPFPEERERTRRQIVQIRLGMHGPKHSQSLRSLRMLAQSMVNGGRLTQGEKLLYSVVQIIRTNPDFRNDEQECYCRALYTLSDSLYRQKRYEDSENVCQIAVQQSEASLGYNHRNTLDICYILASTWHKLEKLRESESLIRDVITRQTEVLGETNNETTISILKLGEVLTSMHRHAEATTYLERAFRAEVTNCGPERECAFDAFVNLSNNYDIQDRKSGTIQLAETLIGRITEKLGKDDPAAVRIQDWMTERGRRLSDEP